MLSLQCPKYDGSKIIRENGHSTSGHQRYQCTYCRHTFQTDYSMKGSDPGMHEKIVAIAMSGSGCRDTSRVLGISLNMVLRHLKKSKPLNRPPIINEKNTIIISAVMDEQWFFVGAKKKPRWLFYTYDRVKRKVLCHVFSRRTKAVMLPIRCCEHSGFLLTALKCWKRI